MLTCQRAQQSARRRGPQVLSAHFEDGVFRRKGCSSDSPMPDRRIPAGADGCLHPGLSGHFGLPRDGSCLKVRTHKAPAPGPLINQMCFGLNQQCGQTARSHRAFCAGAPFVFCFRPETVIQRRLIAMSVVANPELSSTGTGERTMQVHCTELVSVRITDICQVHGPQCEFSQSGLIFNRDPAFRNCYVIELPNLLR